MEVVIGVVKDSISKPTFISKLASMPKPKSQESTNVHRTGLEVSIEVETDVEPVSTSKPTSTSKPASIPKPNT